MLVGGLALIGIVIAASRAVVDARYLGLASILTAFLLIIGGPLAGTAQAVRRLRHNSCAA